MQFSKRLFFLVFNGLVALVLLLYFLFWQLGGSATGQIGRPLQSNVVVVTYQVQQVTYTETFMRSDIPFAQQTVKVRYQRWNPSVARIQSYMGMWAEPLGWALVFLLVSAMLLLTNNTVFSKGTRFRLQKRFPYLLMDEFFPEAYNNAYNDAAQPAGTKMLPEGWRHQKE